MKNFPKVELHRHLEGSFDIATLYKMAKKNNLTQFPTDYNEFVATLQFPKNEKPNFHLFLSKFYNTWYNSLDDVAEVVYNSITLMGKQDQLFYLEERFNPFHYCVKNSFDPVDAFNVVLQAANSAIKKNGYNFRHLITFNRMMQTSDQMVEALKRFVNETSMENVVGVDIAGDEVNFPPEQFIGFFDYVASLGLKATVHAGEVTNAGQIWTAVDKLNASRIGHGVKAIDDEALQNHLKEKNIALEMCLISNYQTGAWSNYATHPLKTLLQKGLCVTLNSDDPTVQGTVLATDYQTASEQLALTKTDFVQLNLNALSASFLSETEKTQLKKMYLMLV